MAIEVGGKTYLFYPYDAFYVNGQQVKEAYFNGVKYYPDGVANVWGGKITAISRSGGSYAYTAAIYENDDRAYYYEVGSLRMSLAWCLLFNSELCYLREDNRRPDIGSYYSFLVLNDNRDKSKPIHAHLELVAKIQADFSEDATSESRTISPFNVHNFSAGSKRLFEDLASGLDVSCSTDVVLGASNKILPTDTSGIAVVLPFTNNAVYPLYSTPEVALSFTDPNGPWNYTLTLRQHHSTSPTLKTFYVDCINYDGTNDGSTQNRILHYRASGFLQYDADTELFPNGVMENSYSRLQYLKFEPLDGKVTPSDLLPLPS